ncbi:putative ubiquitin-like-specific protease 2B [Heracleum sosnowskyi]|uniref:Ubiquitin-like-specific protease 2B n=1 Tax=Heracleum sosnowskyi TaxID=360622 RepID=A0AAD8H2G3_9APIA|nr:putative ubiquitin-like-specific protease 2B [Heracleum sosnowskyi]
MSRGGRNSKNKSKSKFSAFDFDGEEEQINVEQYSQLILNKFKSIPSPDKTTDTSPIDKYTFLQVFAKENKDQDKKSGQEPIHVDATEENEKGCTSSLEVNVVSSSSDSHSNVSRCNNHSDRCCVSKLNSYASRDRSPDIVGTSTSSNRRDDTQYKFPSDSQLIGITSDDEDSIELNSVSKLNCHYVDDEALSAERVLVYGFDGVESCNLQDRAIMFLPVNILIGDELFWDAQLTLTRNHVKLKAEGSVFDSSRLRREWTITDIVSIESVWSKKLSHVGLHLYLRSKDGESAIKVEDSGIVKLDWEVAYPDWPELQNKIWALDSRYKDAWITDSHVDAVNIEGVLMDKFSSHHFRDSDDFVVTFPRGDLDAVSIGWSDVQLLQPKTFINDTVIDFYMKYLKKKVEHKEVPRFHFFTCFFFRKLVDLDGDLSIEHEGREAFLRVHKWTRKLDLFEKDYIFIPVNFSFHWSLIVICHPAEVANLKDEEMKKLANLEEKEMEEWCKMPCILHMDSIKGSHRGLQKLFQSYMSEEWKERNNDLVGDISSRFWDVPFLSLEVPQQKNLFDCGLFLLHYAELFVEEAPENFNPFRILNSSSTFLREQWFSPAEASSKRAHIKDLIYRISVDHSCNAGASDIRSPSESTEVDEHNNSGQILNEFCATDTCLVNNSNCTSHQKFGAKPVVEAPHILQCDGEHKLNNDEVLDCRYNARSPSDRCCHPARQCNQLKSVMSPIEELEESEEQKSAMSYCDKVQNATELKLLPGISVDLQEVKKQDNPHVSGDRTSAVLDLDVEDSDEISSTPSDEFAECVVEDSEEIRETHDDSECQSSPNHQTRTASSDQVVNSTATISLPIEYMLNVGLAHCVRIASPERQPKTPGVKVDFGSPYQQGVKRALSNQESNFIEINDSDSKERMSAKRPRHVLLEEVEPLHKKLEAIVID